MPTKDNVSAITTGIENHKASKFNEYNHRHDKYQNPSAAAQIAVSCQRNSIKGECGKGTGGTRFSYFEK
tara:strand:+ start:170 stop:376 length:207 start_codon:yes stop_codon:yes gene_type:complete